MPFVNYVKEHERFIEYASDERLTASERLLWYALMHICNQRAQGSVWPDEFIRVGNERLLTYCPMKYDTLISARNSLKQRGLIDFLPGDKNKRSPSYKVNYFYPEYPERREGDAEKKTEKDADENCISENSIYSGVYTGVYNGIYNGVYSGVYSGDNIINNNGYETYTKPKNTQDLNIYVQEKDARARETYKRTDGGSAPRRYDDAWMTSARARGAVAGRLISMMQGQDIPKDAHGTLCELMEDGFPPEAMEDVIVNGNEQGLPPARMVSRMQAYALTQGYRQEAL